MALLARQPSERHQTIPCSAGKVDELTGMTDTIEKSVQTFFEENIESLLGVRFLASEFVTSRADR
jgi:hypothetical protein